MQNTSCIPVADEARLIVSCPYEPFSIIHRILPYLAGSANVVVHSPNLQASTLRRDNLLC